MFGLSSLPFLLRISQAALLFLVLPSGFVFLMVALPICPLRTGMLLVIRRDTLFITRNARALQASRTPEMLIKLGDWFLCATRGTTLCPGRAQPPGRLDMLLPPAGF